MQPHLCKPRIELHSAASQLICWCACACVCVYMYVRLSLCVFVCLCVSMRARASILVYLSHLFLKLLPFLLAFLIATTQRGSVGELEPGLLVPHLLDPAQLGVSHEQLLQYLAQSVSCGRALVHTTRILCATFQTCFPLWN